MTISVFTTSNRLHRMVNAAVRRGGLLVLLMGAAFGAEAEQADLLLWGDTHLHTSLSADVYLFGTTDASHEVAYRYARGWPIISPVTRTRVQINRPLDFLVIADHAEMLGTFQRLFDGASDLSDTASGKALVDIVGEGSREELTAAYGFVLSTLFSSDPDAEIAASDLLNDLHSGERRRAAWNEITRTADAYNKPGEFSTFIGWEWSSMKNGSNLHRVVFTPDSAETAQQFLPFSQFESSDPEDLWRWLDNTQTRTGARFVAIPHNPNISDGRMFPLVRENGEPVGPEYADARMRWEPVAEMTQIKGDSETFPTLSPDDPWNDFERWRFILTPDGRIAAPSEGDYLRSALRRGLELTQQIGVNPYQVGMIGSTDSHTAMSSADEADFAGKGEVDAFPEMRHLPTGIGASTGRDMSAAGLAAVWAEANTREAIYDAFRRREVYATTGPRMRVRLFAGYDFTANDIVRADFASYGYAKGVPMGGELSASVEAPRFLIVAEKDPDGADLERVQVVKGWVDDGGKSHERVFDVALAEGAVAGQVPAMPTIDRVTGLISDTKGSSRLSVFWRDETFVPEQAAFYYVRVLQVPTPRFTTLDAVAMGIDPAQTGKPIFIQERAYSSPIWYSP